MFPTARTQKTPMSKGAVKREKKSLDYTQTCRSRGTVKGVLGTRNHSIGLREFLVANTKIYCHNFETDFPWTPLNIEVHMHDNT